MWIDNLPSILIYICKNCIGDISIINNINLYFFEITLAKIIEKNMSSNDILKLMKDKEIEYIDLRFTDPRGKLQHLTMDSTAVDEDMLNEGVFFDGSSIAGWKAINESDMILKPDLSRKVIDPFTSHNTLVLFCDILDAVKKNPYERDQRVISKKAEAYL